MNVKISSEEYMFSSSSKISLVLMAFLLNFIERSSL